MHIKVYNEWEGIPANEVVCFETFPGVNMGGNRVNKMNFRTSTYDKSNHWHLIGQWHSKVLITSAVNVCWNVSILLLFDDYWGTQRAFHGEYLLKNETISQWIRWKQSIKNLCMLSHAPAAGNYIFSKDPNTCFITISIS